MSLSSPIHLFACCDRGSRSKELVANFVSIESLRCLELCAPCRAIYFCLHYFLGWKYEQGGGLTYSRSRSLHDNYIVSLIKVLINGNNYVI